MTAHDLSHLPRETALRHGGDALAAALDGILRQTRHLPARAQPAGHGNGEAALARWITLIQEDTDGPDLGPVTLADEAVAACVKLAEAWAHLRMDTPEAQAVHDRLVAGSRRAAAAYMRSRQAAQPPAGDTDA